MRIPSTISILPNKESLFRYFSKHFTFLSYHGADGFQHSCRRSYKHATFKLTHKYLHEQTGLHLSTHQWTPFSCVLRGPILKIFLKQSFALTTCSQEEPSVNRRRHRSAAKFGSGGILEYFKEQSLPVDCHER